MEKLIFPVSVTQKEQLSGVFIFEFNFDANLRHPNVSRLSGINKSDISSHRQDILAEAIESSGISCMNP